MKHLFEQAAGVDRSAEAPDPEVTAKAKRRRFTGEYKMESVAIS